MLDKSELESENKPDNDTVIVLHTNENADDANNADSADHVDNSDEMTEIYNLQNRQSQILTDDDIKSDECLSILTRITKDVSESSLKDEVCLEFYEESISQLLFDDAYEFGPNEDPDIDLYIQLVQTDNYKKWERYVRECHKYSIPPITLIKDVLEDRTDTLDLSCYIPRSIGMVFALEAIAELPIPQLKTIDLHNSPISPCAVTPLAEFLEDTKTLTYLSLANCRIGYMGIERMKEGLFANLTITHLNLSGCNIRDPGCIIVADALKINNICKELNLSRNNLHTQAAVALGAMLKDNQTLTVLELGWNNLYPEKGCLVKFFTGFRKNTSLIKLGLSFNGISGETLTSTITTAIKKHKALQELDLANNRLSRFPDLFQKLLTNSKSLVSINLGGNPFTEDDIKAILEGLAITPSIRKLSLGDYWITKAMANKIQSIIEIEPTTEVIFKGILLNYPPEPVDFKAILIDRMRALAQKPKKEKFRREMGHFFLRVLEQEQPYCKKEEFIELIKAFRAKVNVEIYEQMADEWNVRMPNSKKRKLDLHGMAYYYLKRYPTKPLPPPRTSKRKSKIEESHEQIAKSILDEYIDIDPNIPLEGVQIIPADDVQNVEHLDGVEIIPVDAVQNENVEQIENNETVGENEHVEDVNVAEDNLMPNEENINN